MEVVKRSTLRLEEGKKDTSVNPEGLADMEGNGKKREGEREKSFTF